MDCKTSKNTRPALSEQEEARRRAARARRLRREREYRRRMKRRRMILGAASVMFLAAAVLIAVVLHLNSEEQREIAVNQALQAMYAAAIEHNTAVPGPTESPAQPSAVYNNLPSVVDELRAVNDELRSVVDMRYYVSSRFVELHAINPDLIGWISLGDTVSAPVVLRDNDFYLSRDFYGNDSASGTVFADELNTDWMQAPFMLLYGHNMREGVMFGKLDDLRKLNGLRRNALLEFQMLYNEEARYYLPFAIVDASVEEGYSDYFYLRRFDIFSGQSRDEQQIADFISEIRSRSIVEIPDLDVAPTDRLLGLVTCSYSSDNARLIVFFREIRTDESASDMCGLIREGARFKQ